MKWLFVICATDNSAYKKQCQQAAYVRNCLAEDFIHMDCIVYQETDPEAIARHACEIADEKGYDGVLAAAGPYTNEIAGRYAAFRNCRCLLGVSDITGKDNRLYVHKQVYQSDMEAVFQIDGPFAAGLAFWKDRVIRPEYIIEPVIALLPEGNKNAGQKTLVKAGKQQSRSDVLVAVGKGLRSAADVMRFRAFARERGYMFGVTRPVAMNGWAGIDEIIGVSGHIYAPKVCITVGVSGSAAFYAGVGNSEWIASVNTDEHAPIISCSDVYIAADYADIWDDLTQIL